MRMNLSSYLSYSEQYETETSAGKLQFNKEGMEKYALEPCYGIHADPFDYKGYVHLQIPKGEDILYPFIDFIYESWGIENIGIREQEQSVFISMKAGVVPIQNSIPFLINL
jgi:hypothetical protein